MRRQVPPTELFRLCREATNWKVKGLRLPQWALTTVMPVMPKPCRAKAHRLVRGRPANSQVVLSRQGSAQGEQGAQIVWSEDQDSFPIALGMHPIVHLRGIDSKKEVSVRVIRC